MEAKTASFLQVESHNHLRGVKESKRLCFLVISISSVLFMPVINAAKIHHQQLLQRNKTGKKKIHRAKHFNHNKRRT